MSGNRTPRAILEARGSKRALEKRGPEIEATGPIGAAPRWMSAPQRKLWRHAVRVATPGVLASVDASVLAAWVVAVDLHAQAVAAVAREGAIIAAPSGALIQNPWLAIQNRQALIALKAAADLGFSPVSRSKVAPMPVKDRPTPAEESLSDYGLSGPMAVVK